MKRVGAVVAAAMALTQTAHADLAAISWKQLLASTDVVVVGLATELRLDERGGGSARLMVTQVLRGIHGGGTIEVGWEPEVHDQRIDRLGATYVLFLQRRGQAYAGAGYGRSYWPVEISYPPDAPTRTTDVVFYRYPITEVLMPGELLVTLPQPISRWPEPPVTIPTKAITLSALSAAVQQGR